MAAIAPDVGLTILSQLKTMETSLTQKMDNVTASNEVVRKDVNTLKTNQQLQHTNIQSIRREVLRNKDYVTATRRELVANMKELEQERKNCILWDRDSKELKDYAQFPNDEKKITEYAFDLIIKFMTTFDRRDFKAKRLKQNEEDTKKGFFRLLISFNNVASAEVFRDRAIQGGLTKIRSGLTKMERQLMFETKNLVDSLNKNNKTPNDFVYARKFMFKVCKVDPKDHSKIIQVLKDNAPASSYRRIMMTAEAPLLPFESGERPTFGGQSSKRKASQEGVGTPGDKSIRVDLSKPPPPLPTNVNPNPGPTTPQVTFTAPQTLTAMLSQPGGVNPFSVPSTVSDHQESSDDEDEEIKGNPKKPAKKLTEFFDCTNGNKKEKIPGGLPISKLSMTDYNALNKGDIKKRSDKQAKMLASHIKRIAELEKQNMELLASQGISSQQTVQTEELMEITTPSQNPTPEKVTSEPVTTAPVTNTQ